jgi:hypothetical protein
MLQSAMQLQVRRCTQRLTTSADVKEGRPCSGALNGLPHA